jgi:hypothetical protein
MFHSTDRLAVANNRLTGMIPSDIGTMTALSKLSHYLFRTCRDDCGLILMNHASFDSCVGSLGQ